MAAHPALRVVLLDLDGTLMDTAPDLAHAANAVRDWQGLAPLPVARIAEFIGKGTDRLIHRSLTDHLDGEVDAAVFAQAKPRFEAAYHQVNGSLSRVFEGNPEALKLLASRGLALACVTNKPSPFTSVLLERSGLAGLLGAVACGDEVARRKPWPDLVELACARLGARPSEAILIGDSENDAQAAHAAGATTVLVETGYNEGVPVQDLAHSPGVLGIHATLPAAAAWILANRALAA
jgi:phosphoglycolate phosphatase